MQDDEVYDKYIVPKLPTENKIPYQQLLDILRVFAYAKREDISRLPNNLICDRERRFWTTWDEVLDIRDRINKEKK